MLTTVITCLWTPQFKTVCKDNRNVKEKKNCCTAVSNNSFHLAILHHLLAHFITFLPISLPSCPFNRPFFITFLLRRFPMQTVIKLLPCDIMGVQLYFCYACTKMAILTNFWSKFRHSHSIKRHGYFLDHKTAKSYSCLRSFVAAQTFSVHVTGLICRTF